MYKNYREVAKALKKHGCEFKREGSSHRVWWSPATRWNIIVPHGGVTTRAAYRDLLKQAGIKD